jgi:hypothetical protein
MVQLYYGVEGWVGGYVGVITHGTRIKTRVVVWGGGGGVKDEKWEGLRTPPFP